MTTRRAGPPMPNKAMQEIREILAEQGGENRAQFEALNSRMDRFERDLRTGNRATDLLASDFQEIRNQFGEVRDAVNMGTGRVATQASQAIPKTCWGKLIAIAVGFTTIMVALNNVPDAVRAWDKMWAALRNDPPAHVSTVEKAEGAPK